MGGDGLAHRPVHRAYSPATESKLAGQPPETKLRLGIGSLADHGGVIEVIDTDGIDVYEHDGVPLVATDLTRHSTAAVDPVLPDGTETSKEDLAQILATYLSEMEPEPEPEPPKPEPEPEPERERDLLRERGLQRRNPLCVLFPRRCRH